jgi:hypothetical protein
MVALDGSHPFRLTYLLLAALVGLGDHLHDFVLQLLQRRLDLRELEELGLDTDHAPFEVLDQPGLILQFGFLALGALLKPRQFGPVAPVLLIQPGSHL